MLVEKKPVDSLVYMSIYIHAVPGMSFGPCCVGDVKN